MHRNLSKSRAKELARKHTEYNLLELVGDEAEEWDEDRRRHEAFESAGIIISESKSHHPEIRAVIEDRALTLYLQDTARVPMEHLSDDISEREALLEHGYWPNRMRRSEAREILAEAGIETIRHGYVLDAIEEVKTAIAEELQDY